MSDADLIWLRYREGEPHARDELIVYYQPLVDRVAAGMATKLPSTVDRADLAGDGILGLIGAIEAYEPNRGVPFESFARQRIRGAILDGLRAIDWAPRSVREPARQLQRAQERLEGQLHRAPTEQEVASEMGMSEEAVVALLSKVAVAAVGHFDPDIEAFWGYAPGRSTREAVGLFDPDRLADALADAIVTLPQRERVVFTLYYVHEVTFEQIGEMLDVSKAWVSQLRDDSVNHVRASLAQVS